MALLSARKQPQQATDSVLCPAGLTVATHQALVVRQHDNDLRIVIPDHSPEIFSRMWQWMLGYDELVTPVVALLQQNKHTVTYCLPYF